MRKVFAAILIMISTQGISQRWVDLGIKGGWGANFLINSNILDDNTFNHRLSGGYTVGGKIGYNLSDMHEITFDVMYTGFKQNFRYSVTDTVFGSPEYDKTFSYNALDFLLMYRMNNEGRYFEIGPKYSLLSKGSDFDAQSGRTTDVSELMAESSFGMALGFGNYFFGTDNFGITFGARITYDFGDIISPNAQSPHYPSNHTYDSYSPSSPLSLLLVCEFNFDFGYIAKANCGQRTKLIVF